jgi:hypothetical protein
MPRMSTRGEENQMAEGQERAETDEHRDTEDTEGHREERIL